MSALFDTLKDLAAEARGRVSTRFGSELLVSDRAKVLIAAAGESGEKTADGLDAILGISGETNDNVLDRASRAVGHGRSAAHGFG